MTRNRWVVGLTLTIIALTGCGSPTTQKPAPTVSPIEAVTATVESTTVTVGPTATPAAFPVTVKDGLGNEITLAQKPMRIVSATLGTDEILLDLVDPERLIGVTYLASDKTTSNIADRPELKQIKNTVQDDPEQIIALEPDLVFAASFTKPEVIDQLKKAKITVFVVGNFTSIEAMRDNILTIGKLVGEETKANKLADQMDKVLSEVDDKLKKAPGPKPSVLYLASEGWTAGSGTTVDNVIAEAGGINAAASLKDWNQLSPEKVIELNPDVVILSPYVTDQEFLKNAAYKNLTAVKNGRVVAITDAHMSAVSQYIVLAVEDVARVLYPDQFK
jgi:iron complex transport system substrate-binding protein